MKKYILISLIFILTGCASLTEITRTTKPTDNVQDDSSIELSGYKYDEAQQFIEMCVELNDQDDRLNYGNMPNSISNIDPTKWIQIYDSRSDVSDKVATYKNNPDSKNPWHKLYDIIIKNADKKYPKGWNKNTLANDPSLNGFGPWQNAWILYQGVGKYAGSYTIAIRGTVISSVPSAIEDVLTNPVSAQNFLSNKVQFVSLFSPDAAVHSGFAHATFTLMLDENFGILKILHDKVPTNLNVYITGHSQGAAMVSLVHAFLHYAMINDKKGSPVFGFETTQYKLKSYGFAQPKPGNISFAADFARITQKYDNAIVINNDIDFVPKTPATLEQGEDWSQSLQGSSLSSKIIKYITELNLNIRKKLSTVIESDTIKSASGYGLFYNYSELKPLIGPQAVSSFDFSPAGRVIIVSGTPGDPPDIFGQHHTSVYRKLIHDQLNW